MRFVKKNITLIIIVIIALLALFVLNDKLPSANQQTITSTGVSSISVTPDKASVYVRIESLKSTADSSKEDNSAKTNAIMAVLKKLEVDIETSQFNIYPEYDWNNYRKIIGYRTSNVLKISTVLFDDLGAIVDAVVGTNLDITIDSINFELSPERESEYKKQALESAGKDAREKAEAIATGMNFRLGKLVSVSSSDFYYRPYPLFEKGASSEDAQAVVRTNIEPSDLDVTATIQATYTIR